MIFEELAEGKRATLLSEADTVIQSMLGYAVSGILSNDEKAKFKAWNEYRKALEDVDVTAADIEWPTKPE
ncbi:tail fiber assembly protein [Zymobacter sp. IVIA_12111.31 C1]|uniref:tail fiber assembly protein n=1 Tax=Zymobacter sp. IVIA_12111.31 C1 TaxID=3394854 RepID=UPI0039C15D05